MATIYPLGDRIKVLPLLPQDKSRGGIIIPASARERPLEGIVLAVGSGILLDNGVRVPMEVEVGDVVQFGRYAGIHVADEVLGLDVLLMRGHEEVLGRKKRAELPTIIKGDPRHAAVWEAEEARAEEASRAALGEMRDSVLRDSFSTQP